MLFLGELHRNWFGSWVLGDKLGNSGPLSSAHYPPGGEEDVLWSASGIGDISIYFGMINSPEIDKIVIHVENKTFDVPLLESSDGNRFYYFERNGSTVPFTIIGLSKEGEIVYTN
ncbi:hypothetical protein [Paenibacillus alkalitolerans]|uniref:hypothetical protein n=1 Tax=Paenibacillus alkalitolerans TaxID=2799335 RepID=UPI0018F48710|nr:hypothetical protein [Paenibacillus alkalitolerans]